MMSLFLYYFFSSGVLILIVIWLGSLKLIPLLARSEVKSIVNVSTLFTLILSTGLLFFIPDVIKQTRAMRSQYKLALYCKGSEVGKHVYETVKNVEGVFSYLPAGEMMDDFMHRTDISRLGRDNYVKLPDKRYKLFASTSFSPNVLSDASLIRYGFTWTSLTSIQDKNDKLFGDETTIFDNQTGKILASRVVYYLLSDDDQLKAACSVGDMDIRNVGYYEGNRVDNYRFVSSVLKPIGLTGKEALEKYDVVPSGGTRINPSICTQPVRIAEGISKDDVLIERSGDNLVVSLKASPENRYSCGFFGVMRSATFADEDKIPRILFADGTYIASPELFSKFGAE